MIFSINRLLIIFLLTLLAALGCNQASDQRDFERDAFSPPEGITETDSRGEVENTDPDDWRISPFFQGVVEVDPAFPNPVQSTDQFSLNVNVYGLQSVSDLIVYAYYGDDNFRRVFDDLRSPIPEGQTSIPLSALDVAQFRENPQGTYRIILLDGNENVITCGDVLVE